MATLPEMRAIEALRKLVTALALKMAADRHGTHEQSVDAQKRVDLAASDAWSVLHEHDHARPSTGNYQTGSLRNAAHDFRINNPFGVL